MCRELRETQYEKRSAGIDIILNQFTLRSEVIGMEISQFVVTFVVESFVFVAFHAADVRSEIHSCKAHSELCEKRNFIQIILVNQHRRNFQQPAKMRNDDIRSGHDIRLESA